MFYSCSSLTEYENLSNWNIENLAKYSFMFKGCPFLNNFPIIKTNKRMTNIKIKEKKDEKENKLKMINQIFFQLNYAQMKKIMIMNIFNAVRFVMKYQLLF